jgi:hypothetical protein
VRRWSVASAEAASNGHKHNREPNGWKPVPLLAPWSNVSLALAEMSKQIYFSFLLDTSDDLEKWQKTFSAVDWLSRMQNLLEHVFPCSLCSHTNNVGNATQHHKLQQLEILGLEIKLTDHNSDPHLVKSPSCGWISCRWRWQIKVVLSSVQSVSSIRSASARSEFFLLILTFLIIIREINLVKSFS